jgi:hypothetical protein
MTGDNGQSGSGLPLAGLLRERQALVKSIRHGESLLLLGPGGLAIRRTVSSNDSTWRRE